MYDNFRDLSQYNFELLRVKMSTSTIASLLAVLGFLVGLGNPAGLGEGPRGIPPDFTLKKVQERIHFRGEGERITKRSVRVVCVSYGLVDAITSPFYPLFRLYLRDGGVCPHAVPGTVAGLLRATPHGVLCHLAFGGVVS